MYTEVIERLKRELKQLIEEDAPYEAILAKSQELDPYVAEQQRLLNERAKGAKA